MEAIDFARKLAAMGAPVFTTRGRNKEGQPKTPTTQERLNCVGDTELAGYKPGDNLGMLTGYAFDVIDIDTKNGDGFATVDALTDVYPRTWARVRTPSAGLHEYTRSVQQQTVRHGHVDYQSNGMFVWLPGTVRPHGTYTLEAETLDQVDQRDESAAVFYATFKRMRDNAKGTATETHDWGKLGMPIPAGVQDATLAAYTMKIAKQGKSDEHIVADVKLRADDCVPPWKGPDSIETCVLTRWLPGALTKLVASGWDRKVAAQALYAGYEKSDVGNAKRLRDHEDGNIKYSRGIGWLWWNGNFWAQLDEEEVVGMAIRNSERIMIEARQLPDVDAKAKGRAIAWGERSQMMEHITKCVAALRGLDGVRLDPDQLDARPDLLTVGNGTVELRTGVLRAAAKDDYITKALTIDYSPTAKSVEWCQFLESCHAGQEEVIGYLQQLVGYGITGSVSEQAFAMMVGKGANGKSVFTDALSRVFRQITRTAAIDTFLQHRTNGGAGHSSDLAALRGARLVFTSESNQGDRLDEAKMKQLTGGDRVPAREAYGKQFEYVPQFLLVMSSNALPNIYDASDGTWRRLKLVHWPHSFAKHPDKGLPDRLRTEDEGILTWAVEGAREWYAAGCSIQTPDVVVRAVDRYREDQDELQGFISLFEREGFTTNVAIYKLYREWCEDEGTKPWQRKTLFAALRAKDVEEARRSNGPGWRMSRVV